MVYQKLNQCQSLHNLLREGGILDDAPTLKDKKETSMLNLESHNTMIYQKKCPQIGISSDG